MRQLLPFLICVVLFGIILTGCKAPEDSTSKTEDTTTETGTDSTAPIVSSTSPANSATSVSLDTSILVTFS